MPNTSTAEYADPRHEIERYTNNVSVQTHSGHVHLTFTVDRPKAGQERGDKRVLEHEVVARVVMPEDLFRRLAQFGILSGSSPSEAAKPAN